MFDRVKLCLAYFEKRRRQWFSCPNTADRVTWFENTDGAGTFALGVDLTEEAEGSKMVIAADMDGDEDTDVIGVSQDDNRVTWYENSDGAGGFDLGVDLATDVGEAT